MKERHLDAWWPQVNTRLASLEAAGPGEPPAWGEITGTLVNQIDLNSALASKAASSHTHAISDTTGLQTELDGKAASGHSHSGLTPAGGTAGQVLKKNTATDYDYGWAADNGGGGAAWGGITGTLADQADLQGALDGKQVAGSYAAASHAHPQSDVTNLVSDLAGKAATSHTHNANDINAGTLATARLGSGTADGTTFLRGDQTWATPPGGGYTFVGATAADLATGANVTPISLTGLVFNYVANSTYRIWFMGRISPAAATTGCGFQFDLSTAVTSIDVQFSHQLANTGTLSGGHSIADDASVGVSSGLPGTSNYPVTGQGLLRTGANAGTAQLRFRSETTAVITARAGFTLVIEKVL